ncbi:hypothetical protein [Ornithinibacillus halotolerans]|uniref:Uncharacterized protein n=1 Tax=Ornithinibacillus halotolerans TaxID=1274357 RepID=A0A916RLP9_9BACI|nr:hypothetical protein [Ornithinibacillus halotolerans]GGA61991.1 hypothetical protein GCM10008025_02420 [Ornithinibacillus halotolerans]
MNEREQFQKLLKVAKQKIGKKRLMNHFYVGLFVLGLGSVFLLLLARFFVIPHLLEKICMFGVLVFIGTIVLTILKRPTEKEAATYFDQFVADNHVTTAYHYRNDTGVMIELQLKNTIQQMKQSLSLIQADKIFIFRWKNVMWVSLLLVLSTTLYFLPNETMRLAKQKEVDQEIAKETKEEINKLVEEKDLTKELEELMEQTDSIKESKELLEELLKQEKKLAEQKAKAEKNEQQLEELAEKTKSMQELSEALDSLDTNKLSEAMDKLMEKDLASLTEDEQETLEKLFSDMLNMDNPDLSSLSKDQLEEMLASLEEQLQNMIESVQSLDQILALQDQLQNLATSLQQNMAQNGLSDQENLAFGNPNEQNQQENGSNSSSNGNSNEDGESNGASEGNGNNEGTGAGQGSGNEGNNSSGNGGSGTGSGSGSGNGGTGNGSGGSGAGFGQGSRELTIPEIIDGQESIEEDFGEMGEGDSEFQLSPDGLVLKGTVRSYEDVYGDYEKSYRNSVDRLELPSYLEDVIRDYFSDLAPEGE